MIKSILLLLLLLPSLVFADVAMIVASRGDVISDGKVLAQGDEVCVGALVETGSKSFAVLQFKDGSKVTIRPNSQMVIEEYKYMDTEQAATISLVSGGLRIVTGAIAKNDQEDFKVRTPVALMGVRGTEFSIQYIEETK